MTASDDMLTQEAASLRRDNAPAFDYSASDALLQNEVDTRKAHSTAVLDMAVQRNPNKAAEAKLLSAQFQLDVPTVERNQDELSRISRVQQMQSLLAASPVLARQMLDPDFATVAQNDVPALKSIEEGFGSLLKWAMGNGPNQGLIGSAKAAPYVAASNLAGIKRFGVDLLGAAEPGNDGYFGKLSQQYGAQARAFDASAKAVNPPEQGLVGGGLSSGGDSLMQNLKYMPLALTGPLGAGVALGGMAAETFGSSYNKASEKGLALLPRTMYATADGVIEWATEKGPLGALLHNVKAGAPLFQSIVSNAWKENKGEQAATALQGLNEWAMLNPGQSLTEHIKGMPADAAQTLISVLVGSAGNVTLGHTMQQVADRANGRNRQLEYLSRQAEEHAQVLEGLQTTMQASEILKHSPETLTAYMQGLADQGAPNVYVDSAKLVEAGIDLQALARVVPSIAAQLDQVQSGGDLVIPTSELLTNTIGSEFAQPLIDNARTDVNGMSRTEAKVYMQEQGNHINAEIERVMTEKANDTEFKAGRDQVQAQLLTDLNEVKRFTPKVNEHYATLAANFYAVMAARTGMTVQQFADTYKLGFSGKTTAGAGMYDQGGKLATEGEAFKGWFGNSKVVDGGKPLVVYHGTVGDITSFSKAKLGETTGAQSAKSAFFFTDHAGTAADYSGVGAGRELRSLLAAADKAEAKAQRTGKPADWDAHAEAVDAYEAQSASDLDFNSETGLNSGANVLPVYLALKNPLIKDFKGEEYREETYADLIAQAKAAGNDGVVFQNTIDPGNPSRAEVVTVYAVFDPTQIKSVNNRGTFDTKDANILHQSTPWRSARDKVIGLLRKTYEKPVTVPAKNGDEIIISYGGLRHALNNGVPSLQETALALHIQDAIRTSEKVGSQPDKLGRNDPYATTTYTTDASFDGVLHDVTVFVRNHRDGNRYYDHATVERKSPPGRPESSAAPESGNTSPTPPSSGLEISLSEVDAGGNAFGQDARAQIAFGNDITQQASIISMMKGADLSSFIHEGGHFFLEVQADLATRIAGRMAKGEPVSDGERSIVGDFNATLDWMGVKGSPELSAMDTWYLMTADEKRAYHEQWARGFEAYAFEGKSPSMELTKMFQTFRAWLVNVYRAMLKSVNASKTDIADTMKVELSDEVRAVMDRMLATSDQIQEAEAARNMGPLFKTPEEAGMDLEAYKLYHDMGTQSTMDAVDELQAKGLRDMQWLHNARSRKLKELQKQHDALRLQIAREVRAEVLSQPLYRAWTFLTAKGGDKVVGDKPAGQSKGVNPEVDNLFTAIDKLGGLDAAQAKSQWGAATKDGGYDSGVFGKPVLRKTGGIGIDAMAERLIEHGYLLPDEHGKADLDKFEALFDDQTRGIDWYSISRDMAAAYGDAPVNLPDMPDVARGKLRTEDLRYMYGEKDDAVWRKLSELRMTSDETGLHPEVVAELFGFTSGDELVRALADAEPPKSVIEGRTDQRMLEEHGDLATPAGLERAADMAIHNDARVRFVATELRALQHAMSVREKVPGKKHTVDVLVQAAKEHASAVINRLKVRDIRPAQYAAAEVRSAKAAVAAKGDLPKQAEAKRNQLINLYAAKAAYAAQEEIKKAITYFKKFDSNSVRAKLPTDYVGQIDMLLEKFDLRAQSGVTVDRTKTLRTWVQSRLNAGEIPNISEQLLTPEDSKAYSAAINARDDEGNLVYPDDDERIKLLADAIERSTKRSIKDMTVEEVRGLRETIQQIEHLGRLKDKMLTKMEGEGYAATRDLLTATVVANAKEQGKNTRTDNTWLGGKLDGLKQFGASHIKPAIWMRIFDGGQDNGPWWSTIVRPANERASFETSRRAAATSKLMEILGPVLKDVPHMDKIGKGKFFPALNTSLNWEERMAFAFNYGNESNLQRLMGGGIAGVTKALSMEQVQAVLNTLSAAEWTAVQGVWDHFESYRAEIGAKELRVNGVEPVWIDARPFAIKTADGQTLELRGGYFPVKFDGKTSLKAQQHSDAQAAKDAMKAAYSAATTQRSFTKERVEEVTGRPLLLNLQGLYSGVNDVIHDLAWHEWVIDVNRLLRSDSIDAAIREHYGANVKRELTKWRDDIVAGSARLDHGIENAAGWARKFVSSAALTYNVISALMQPLGITQSFARVGTEWVGMGLGQYLSDPVEATKMVQGKSEYMTNRTRTMFRDVNELRNQVQGQTTGRELMGRYGYFLTMHFQMMVDVPTWIGAYEKGLAGGFDDKTAIALADQSVKDSQGGGEEVDQSGITRGGPMIKLFTAFYDFMNTQANVLYLKNATAENKADKFTHMAVVGLVTPLLAAALRDALIAGDSGDWDDWEKAFKKMLSEGLGNLIGMVAFGREFSQVAKALMGEDKGLGYSGPTGLRVIPDAYKLAKQASQGELDDAFRKALINAVGDVAGIPAVQINRTITGIKALDEGKTSNPAAVVTGYQEPH
jgi:hypothetical protein